jgi:hypothetical protein
LLPASQKKTTGASVAFAPGNFKTSRSAWGATASRLDGVGFYVKNRTFLFVLSVPASVHSLTGGLAPKRRQPCSAGGLFDSIKTINRFK